VRRLYAHGPKIHGDLQVIEWNKIVTNAISALVVAVFLGASTIVWKGATSVDDKVQGTRRDMTHLIDSLSGKLAGYEVQLESLSNQLSIVIYNQSNIVNTAVAQSMSAAQARWRESRSNQLALTTPPLLTPLAVPPTNRISELLIPQKEVTAESIAVQAVQKKAYTQDIKDSLSRPKTE